MEKPNMTLEDVREPGEDGLDRLYHNPHPPPFVKVDVPEGTEGDWKVDKFTVEDSDVMMENLRSVRDGHPERIIPAGAYTRLSCKGRGIIMSDTPAEAWENRHPVRELERMMKRSDKERFVLINGLGLGMVLDAILTLPYIEAVIVVEKSPEVIKLVGSKYDGDKRVSIHNDDALRIEREHYSPQTHFDVVWHDIWDAHLNDDTIKESRRLYSIYRNICTWQGSWSYDFYRRDQMDW